MLLMLYLFLSSRPLLSSSVHPPSPSSRTDNDSTPFKQNASHLVVHKLAVHYFDISKSNPGTHQYFRLPTLHTSSVVLIQIVLYSTLHSHIVGSRQRQRRERHDAAPASTSPLQTDR
ncbi:hypothetical protein GGR58DRAFT_478243 [Xylaria digitata]|nr:hypothetical protein GGR58DRAFT_478243 [Xylaria digitata]